MIAGLLALELELTVGLADAGHRLSAIPGRRPGTCRCHCERSEAISATFTVTAGASPAMTVNAGVTQYGSTLC
jgi:hypothetical protein